MELKATLLKGVNAYVQGLIRTGSKLTAEIAVRLDDLESALTGKIYRIGDVRAATITHLIGKARSVITEAYHAIAADHNEGLVGVVIGSSKTFSSELEKATVEDLTLERVEQAAAKQLIKDTLIDGAKSAEWWSRQSVSLTERFLREMRLGLLYGEGIEDLIRRVRGTKANNYTDGIMPAPRAQAEALVRTSVVNVANGARVATYLNERDLIKGVEWVATEDDRTTEICLLLNGKTWTLPDDVTDFESYEPIGHRTPFPGFTAHWNCRSTQLPVLKTYAELGK